MKKLINILLLLTGWMFLLQQVHPAHAQTDSPQPEDIITAINEWRTSEGVPLLIMDARLMTSAQQHSEYQASINYYTYYGADKSNVTQRAQAEGFGEDGSVVCQEVLAFTSISTVLDTVINSIWNNARDRDLVLLNPELEYIGAGISRKNASLFYAVDVCSVTVQVQDTPPAGGSSAMAATPRPESDVVEVILATPGPDGAIYHLVESGQAVWSIAIAYGTTINEIVGLNGLNPSNPQIFAGQTLLIRMANTPTVTPTISPTPRPPTQTPSLTSTRVITSTATITPTATKEPLIPAISDQNLVKTRPIGYILAGISALGFVLVVISLLRHQGGR